MGDIEVTRVDDPGFELVLPQDDVTTAALLASTWLRPHFVTEDGALVIGSSATVVRTPHAVVLVDPFLAFGGGPEVGPRLQALRESGVEAEDVDVVVNTHVDGLGVNLLPDGSPTFPRARYLVPAAEIEAIRSGAHPQPEHTVLVDLHDHGAIEASRGDEIIAPGVTLADAPGHNPGHHVVWLGQGDQEAVVVGHLFLHPAQIASPDIDNGDLDPVLLAATRRTLLGRCETAGALLIGPLFAAPGAGTVCADGASWRLDVSA